ncbi:hypothetical protein ACH43Y_13890 [Streptomyces rubiginosohelvolus]|uniref:hypothetical protein n=1 Tax=Streptomyces rubiginosohelvolus TaxID=67362 RepID=UPI0037B187E3
MPEETESTEQQQAETGTEETVEETGTEVEGTESTGDAQEAETEEKPFDRAKFEAELKKKNSESKNLRDRLRKAEAAQAELQAIKDAEKTDVERLTDKLAAAEERVTATRQKLVRSQVQALAMAGFADPEDAVGALDLGSYIDSDGDIDEAAIKADLDALLERKPHWARVQPQEGPRRPAPDRTQASGANKTRPLKPEDEFSGWLSSQLK